MPSGIALVADAFDRGRAFRRWRGRRRRACQESRIFTASRAQIAEAAHGVCGHQGEHAVRARIIEAVGFVGEQQAAAGRSTRQGVEAVFGVEQDRAGVRSERGGDGCLEFGELGVGNGGFGRPGGGGEHAAQAAALIHGDGGDGAALGGDGAEALEFSGVSSCHVCRNVHNGFGDLAEVAPVGDHVGGDRDALIGVRAIRRGCSRRRRPCRFHRARPRV